MIIKTLEGGLGKVILKLNYEYKEKNQEVYLFESNVVDSNKNQKLTIDTWCCADKNEAITKLQNFVEHYLEKGYKETHTVKKENAVEKIQKTSFLGKIFKKFNK